MDERIPFLPGLSPVAGKELCARFDGGRLSSDGGVLLLREVVDLFRKSAGYLFHSCRQFFKREGSFPASRRMSTPWTVEAVYVFTQGRFRLSPCPPDATPDELSRDSFEERFHDSIEAPISVKLSRVQFLACKYVDIFHAQYSELLAKLSRNGAGFL